MWQQQQQAVSSEDIHYLIGSFNVFEGTETTQKNKTMTFIEKIGGKLSS